ncbi:DUF1778 domain-containing protein [Patulibacter sp. NPDC049589]|uniref:type II toxin-antitoxin system TacA family antitoxin n=1 Tax=Patulibacter sp. NPDC049589 TaxID=3154731 RepID=UPI00343A6325
MATKSSRIEVRTEPEREAWIARAAAAEDLSVSAFVIGAATREADRVMARREATAMSAEQFDQLIEALDEPDPAERLRAVARRPRRFDRA